MKGVVIYTDGACSGNPGPGGYAAILIYNTTRKVITGGYRLTTNNRMEIMAAIAGLSTLQEPCKVTVYSDSQYLVNAVELGWAKRWQANGWMRTSKAKAQNADLLKKLLDLCTVHKVKFVWIPGHSGILENEQCNSLAAEVIFSFPTEIDAEFEKHYSSQKPLFDY